MNIEKRQHPKTLQRLTAVLSKADQTIEEWVHHFINQIEQSSGEPDEPNGRVKG